MNNFRFHLIVSLFAIFVADAAWGQNQTQIRPGAAPRTGSTSTAAGARRTTSTTGGSSAFSSGPRQYRNNTVLGDAVIQVDPETRQLVIISDDETHDQIMKVIKNLDKPKPQVLIKVVFLEVTYNNAIDVGLEGSYTFHTGNPLLSGTTGAIGSTVSSVVNALPIFSGTTQTGSSTTTTTSTSPVFGTSSGTITPASVFGLASTASTIAGAGATGNLVSVLTSDYQATLRAIASKGNIDVLSKPSIMARNNQEAVIVVGQEVPFVTNSTVNQNGNVLNTIQYNDVGIILRVTPFINPNRTIEMIVAPEISTVSNSSVQVTNNVSSPLIDKRSAETVVVTPNATTVVIGGLIQTQNTRQLQKVPILGDIPLLGLAFRRLQKATSKRELVIFLTPYIVDSPESFKEVSLGEVNRTELIPKAFTPEEISTHLDTLRLEDEDALPAETGTPSYEIRRVNPDRIESAPK